MPDPVLFLQGMATAAGASAGFALACGAGLRCLNWKRFERIRAEFGRFRSPTRNSAEVLGMALGVIVGLRVLRLQPAWPPVNGLGRLLTIVFPAVVAIELLAGFERLPRRLAWLTRVALAAASGRILLHDSVYLAETGAHWTGPQAVLTLSLAALSLVAAWGILSGLSRREPGSMILNSLALATQCAGILVMLAGYLRGGTAALPFAAALLGTSAAATLNTRFLGPADATGALGIGVVGLFGLLFVGRFFGGLSTGCALTVFFAPLLCCLSELPYFRNRPAWFKGLLRLVLVAILLLAVLFFAKRDFDRNFAPLLTAYSKPQPSVDLAVANGLRTIMAMGNNWSDHDAIR